MLWPNIFKSCSPSTDRLHLYTISSPRGNSMISLLWNSKHTHHLCLSPIPFACLVDNSYSLPLGFFCTPSPPETALLPKKFSRSFPHPSLARHILRILSLPHLLWINTDPLSLASTAACMMTDMPRIGISAPSRL